MSSRRGQLGMIGALALGVTMLAGCGGTHEVTKSEYGTELRAATSGLDGVSGDISRATAPSKLTTQQRIAQIRSIQLGLRESGNELADVTPPAHLRDEHEQLVSGVRDMADAVDLLIRAEQLSERDPARATALLRRFATDPSLARVQEATTRIAKAGVDAGI